MNEKDTIKEQFLGTTEGRFGVLLDSMNHKIDLLVEGMTNLFQRQERVENKLDAVEQRLGAVETRLTKVETTMTNFQSTVATKSEFKNLEKRTEGLELAVF